jgi:copper transport protein
MAPIEVPLVPYEDQKQEESFGFVRYSFKAEGAYLPLRGNWLVEVRVMDADDNEKVYKKETMVY